MGQPITVVEKPSRRPGIARFETNRWLTGMGHERYRSIDDVVDDKTVDQLAKRLFDTGGVRSVHVAGSVITVELTEGWSGDQLLDVIRGLHIHYPATTDADADVTTDADAGTQAESPAGAADSGAAGEEADSSA